jgi:uncharacterized YigZ family protein
MQKDTFHTIGASAEGLFKDKGSKFLAFAFPIQQEGEVHVQVDALRKAHPKARHFCYAYRIGLGGLRFRANDDGEPSGTAGRPILGQIDSFGLTNVAVVVVRYFGGTLLGAAGLIQAYRAAAADALRQAPVIEQQLQQLVRLEFPYSLMNHILHAVKKLGLPIYAQQYGEQGTVTIGIPLSSVGQAIQRLQVLAGGLHPEEVEMGKTVEGLIITLLPEG